MKRNLLLIALLAFVGFACHSEISTFGQNTITGDGTITSEEFETGDFSAVRIYGAYATHLHGDRTGKVKLTGDQNLLDYVHIEVDKGVLTIRTKEGYNLRPSERLLLDIPGRDVNTIRVSGSNRIALQNIDQDKLEIRGSGSTRISGSGRAGHQEIRMSGSSRIDAGDLVSERVEIRTSGSSRATLHVTERLDARSSGSSRIRYYGNPARVNSESSGSSSVREAG